jgi:hypothetical protein
MVSFEIYESHCTWTINIYCEELYKVQIEELCHQLSAHFHNSILVECNGTLTLNVVYDHRDENEITQEIIIVLKNFMENVKYYLFV